eukprot:1188185-Prorocentrum_minimum.AAC.1
MATSTRPGFAHGTKTAPPYKEEELRRRACDIKTLMRKGPSDVSKLPHQAPSVEDPLCLVYSAHVRLA